MINTKEVGAKLREIRKSKGLKAEMVCRALELSPAQLSKDENGANITLRRLLLYAAYYNLELFSPRCGNRCKI